MRLHLMGFKTKAACPKAGQNLLSRPVKGKFAVSLLALLFALQHLAFAQAPENTAYDPAKIFSAAQLKTDFDILTAAIAKTHPALYTYVSPEAWQQLTTETQSQLASGLTEDQFQVLVRKYLATIRCGHTVALPSEAWYAYQKANPKLLPVKVYIHQDKLYVKEAFDADSVLTPGTEITAIGNVSAATMLEEMRAIQPRDGHGVSFVNASVESAFQTYCLLLLGKKETYVVGYHNPLTGPGLVAVKGGTGKKKAPEEAANTVPVISGIENRNGRFYISAENAKVGILEINSFGNSDYRKFYKAVFKQIRTDKVEHLVIDVRHNGGGYFPHAVFLLRNLLNARFAFTINRPERKIRKDAHVKMDFVSTLTNNAFNLFLADKDKSDPNVNYALNYKPRKKHQYKGKLYVLTNGSTFSISSYTASLLKHKAGAVVIGQETGGGEVSTNGILFFRVTLPETGTRLVLPYYQLESVRGAAQTGRGVMPDFPVVYSKEDILESKDKELEQAMQIIGQGSGL